MATIYTKDKTVKITFRCEDSIGDWVSKKSKGLGITPSALVRQLLFQAFYAEKAMGEALQCEISNLKSQISKTSAETAVRKCRRQG